MILRRLSQLLFGLLLGSLGNLSAAELRLHSLFSDNMVVQQGSATVWGWAEEGAEVLVELQGRRAKGEAREGRWQARLRRLDPGGPFEMRVSAGEKRLILTNVMVGEVWIASGQSNMQWPLSRAHDVATEIASANRSGLRLFTVPRLKADEPLDNVDASWNLCTPASAPGFSAVGYYFGRDLQEALKVPVGIIHTSWGGSPAEVWMSQETLSGDPDYRRDILDPFPSAFSAYQQRLAEHEKERAAAAAAGVAFSKRRPSIWKPSELYNGMIAPLIPFEIRGAIWYQGEANAGRAYQYRTLFPDLIRNWREDWGIGKFPFLLVQLAPFRKIQPEPGPSSWAELREAQALATSVLPDVGMAVITDVGEEDDIHPRKKEPVGARLALAARGIAYDEDIVYSGPVFRRMRVRGGKAYLSFNHVGSGLEARGGDLTGFTIAGANRRFVAANAVIDRDRVVVSSPEVAQPVAVRFGWADYPVVNLWNKDGLPASPFRTDQFPMLTAPKSVGLAALIRKEFIYEDAPFPSCHASTLAETHEGLVAAWFGGTDEGNDDVGIWLARHEGGNWTAPQEVANGVQPDGKRYPCWNPVLHQPTTGPLLLFHKVGPSPSKWWGVLIQSSDGGRTWSEPQRLPDGILGPVRNKPVVADGVLLCPSSSEHDGWRIHLERTGDLGKNWTRTDALNDGKEFGAIQPTILDWRGDSMQMLCRSRQGVITEVWSGDDGDSWQAMAPTALPNPNSGIDAVMLADRRALLVYNHTRRGRTPLNVAVTDDGKGWGAALVLESEPGEYSYPAVIQTRDGMVHATYTWKRKRIRHVIIDPKLIEARPIVDGRWAD